ncbi:MAG: peptidyl-prolyl cis-trans isomerase [Candidatus Poribacteria bacterium]|nr:peptidyl-prolyl cis-trans isomerase [Candidatus Poribacteria bacterium]
MKYFVCLCFIMLLISINFVYAQEPAKPAKPKGEPVDIKVAEVNGDAIFMSDLTRQLRIMVGGNTKLSKADYLKAKDEALESLINQELLYQEGKKEGLESKDADVEAEVAKVKQNFPTQEAFDQVLKMQGLTEPKFIVMVKKVMTMRDTIKVKVQPLAKLVTDKETQDYYEANKDKFTEPEQVKARHILIKSSPNASEQEKTVAKNKIDSILKEIRDGGDFSELAKKDSECPSAPQGGDLGFFSRGQMVKPFEDVAFALEPGQVSDVVETEFGYHIIRVDEKKPGKQLELEKVQERIKEVLTNEEIDKALAEWLKPIKENSSIKILVKSEATTKAETTAKTEITPKTEEPKK